MAPSIGSEPSQTWGAISRAAHLIPLPIRLRGHADECGLLAVIVVDLSEHNLE
jgi:hypothetical protein